MKKRILFVPVVVLLLIVIFSFHTNTTEDGRFVTYEADVKKQDVQFYWKDDKGDILKNIGKLKSWLEKNNKTLVFAMNGGMYKEDNSPLGLYIENNKVLARLNKSSGNGNFYLKPNGVLYITTGNVPVICETSKFINNGKIKYATQSGPMLVLDGEIHSAFKKGSSHVNIRNGVGVLPGNKLVFAMSKEPVNLYDFADYFKSRGCRDALYLDGFVSRTYLPDKQWIQTDGNFGVMIGVTTGAK